ncbi:hypothetical protein B0H14DRAFT_1630753 [Mycena olivaceomarginata]|nr:hypothetical protein B0H14DRAFT_1630753 [Mycena olivaceomarginata]
MKRVISLSNFIVAGSGFPHEYRNGARAPMELLRADTPFTSVPLRDDFDAVTQRWSRTTRVTTIEPTATGLFTQLEAATRATTPAVPNPRRRRNRETASDGRVEIPRRYGENGEERSLRRMRGKDRIRASDVDGRTRTPPQAGQDYEIVESQVLEQGPERTVTISTWREQAIDEADSDDNFSVFYVNPEDCIPLGPTVEIFREAHGSGSKNPSGRSGGRRQSSGNRREAENPSADRLTSPSGVADTSPKTYRAVSKASPQSSGPRTSTPRGSSNTLIQPLDADPYPFHAKKTKSGSTISSIHLTPTLEDILISCEPSLLHICPVLQRVGILGAEHLRAVGKLSEETRNKEVKEEVLKLGVTVIEWAILLDKLQAL